MGEADKKDEILSKNPNPIEGYWLKVLKANMGISKSGLLLINSLTSNLYNRGRDQSP